MTVAEAQERIDSREFSEWIAYNQLEWFTDREHQAFLQSGIIASTVANCSMSKKKGRALAPKDFMPSFSHSDSSGSNDDEMFAKMQAFSRRQNAAVKKREDVKKQQEIKEEADGCNEEFRRNPRG